MMPPRCANAHSPQEPALPEASVPSIGRCWSTSGAKSRPASGCKGFLRRRTGTRRAPFRPAPGTPTAGTRRPTPRPPYPQLCELPGFTQYSVDDHPSTTVTEVVVRVLQHADARRLPEDLDRDPGAHIAVAGVVPVPRAPQVRMRPSHAHSRSCVGAQHGACGTSVRSAAGGRTNHDGKRRSQGNQTENLSIRMDESTV
jgi:hypothetical protein